MKRGEVWWAELPAPAGSWPGVVRDASSFTLSLCPILDRLRHRKLEGLSPFPFNPVMEVDPQAAIADSDRSNNNLGYPQPNPTGCDVLCVGPTPTPARLP